MNDIPKLGEFRYPYPKNPPTYTDETIKGYIIEIEGLDGSGKSSQTKALVENLKNICEKVYYVNFIHSEYIKDILLKTKWENCDLNTFSFMYFMGLSNTYYREILPRLRQEYIVVLDRYIYTIISKNVVFNSSNEEWVENCSKIFRKPDLKIFIDTSVEECLKRKNSENEILSYWECGSNFYYEESLRMGYNPEKYKENFMKYQESIKEVFEKYIKEEKNWNVIDGNKSKEQISKEIYNISKNFIEKRKINE